MNRWLLKSNPDSYSLADLEDAGRDVWDGVKNNTALMHLREMRRGDRVLFYHSGKEKAVVGEARIAKGPYPDPEEDDPRLVVVDIDRAKAWKHAVGLDRIKATPKLREMPLLKISRLSVMPVATAEWDEIVRLAREA